jgi:hypothetical protein
LKCEIPASFYLINEYNNTLEITTNTGTTTYQLTYGNYNINTFITALKSLLGSSYSFTYNSITNKLTISYISSFTITSNTTMYRFLGLEEGVNTSSTNNSITSTFVCNFLPLTRLHFRSPDLYIDSFNTYDQSNDIFLSLQNNSNSLGVITYLNTTEQKFLMDMDYLEKLTIQITDDKNRLINFQNVNWYMTIEINLEYFETQIKGSLSKFLRLYTENNNEEYIKYLMDNKNKENL